jgi:hypothetical protein
LSSFRPRPEDAERGDHPHQLALLVGGLEHDHGQAGIGAVLGHHALDQGALLALRARRGIAADLPVAMHRAHRALRMGRLGQGEKKGSREQGAREAENHLSAHGVTGYRFGCRLLLEKPHTGRSFDKGRLGLRYFPPLTRHTTGLSTEISAP